VPATTTTESLITSIEKASEKNKIKIASINDYTAENVEIEITPMRGQDPKKTLKALYAYTDCSVSVNVNLMVICDNAPVQMTVNEVLRRNTGKLLTYLKRELEIELEKLNIRFHEKTLAQIFIENRIYKRIEKCETYELVFSEVRAGLEKFKDKLKHEITNENIEKLLEIRIKRISLFDINKNQKEIKDILAQIKIVERNLKNLKEFAINYIMDLINKYGKFFPRKTEIEKLDKIDITKVALNNIKVGWDRKNSYIGTNIKSDEQITCNEFDKLLCVTRNGKYKVINIPDKLFCGKLFDFRKYDSKTEFGVVYTEKKTGKIYAKRTVISKYITDKEYTICPDGCRLEVITPRPNSVYECVVNARIKDKREFELNLMEMPQRTPRARGKLVNVNKLKKISFIRLLEEPENSREEPPEKIEEKTKSTPATEASPEPVPETQQKNPQQKEKKETRKKKEPSAKEIEETRQKSKRGKTPVAPEPKPENNRENDKDENSDDEDWGISQPELGF
jgi:topoisomerase-4 subunit A